MLTIAHLSDPPARRHPRPADGPDQAAGPDTLADVLARHPSVVAVLVGHAHTAAATTSAGLPLLIAPGVASTVVLPGESGPRVNHSMPPGLALHLLDDGGRVMTHYRYVT